jgi:hypothetical protein
LPNPQGIQGAPSYLPHTTEEWQEVKIFAALDIGSTLPHRPKSSVPGFCRRIEEGFFSFTNGDSIAKKITKEKTP